MIEPMAGTTQPRPARGPLGTGPAMVQPTSPHTVAEDQSVGGIVARAEQTQYPTGGMRLESALTSEDLRKAPVPNCRRQACCLKPYRGKTRPLPAAVLGEGGWKRVLTVETAHPPA